MHQPVSPPLPPVSPSGRPDLPVALGKVIRNSPAAHAIRLLGDRWSFLVIRDAFLGRTRFDDFVRTTGAPRSTLTKRLSTLTDRGVLVRQPYQQHPPRDDYVLTPMGEDLYDFAVSVWHWEITHGPKAAGAPVPDRLRHRLCGQAFDPVTVCLDCGAPVLPREVAYRVEPDQIDSADAALQDGTPQRRSRPPGPGQRPADPSMLQAAELIGDQWTPLLISALLLGIRRYDEFQRELKAATNILADRLRLLVEAGVVRRIAYQDHPVRYEYRLTRKGRDLYPVIMALHRWGERWLVPDAAVGLQHHCTDTPLATATVCSYCRHPLKRGDVTFKVSVPVR